jgi:hypothetical protein
VNVHIANHLIVSVGAILLFIAAFFGRGRRAPLHVRLLLLLIGPVGVAWSIIGIYLIDHTTSQDHTTLPWAQFWMLDHIKSNLGGIGVGLLLALGLNPELYRRQHRGTATSNQALERTGSRHGVQFSDE